ncbi:hypothetical protein BLS_007498 [Venturia inaequalis]|uniref:DUF2828 domain-containing protein n=1 Tax=Venturia inaequalis TaxID=5025 RepID=A0A8H3UEH1_VENIN|nr:hypothetical protein BLS_007498 [Venturia inaequalis]KAE9969092.1 hypothetical protein EG327_010769 [Venturia inaequalis]
MAETKEASAPRRASTFEPMLFASDQEFAKYIGTLKPSVEPTKIVIEKNDNTTQTDNGDDALVSTKNPLVDLFYELKEDFVADQMEQTLAQAWNRDSLATLKILWNSRSIHLGKGTRPGAYRALGWLYQHHPQTFIANLIWLVRPVINLKPAKKDDAEENKKGGSAVKSDDEFDVIGTAEGLPTNPAAVGASTTLYDVDNGGAHGYWKDLPNLLALAVNDQLKINGDVGKVFNVSVKSENPRLRNWSKDKAKEDRKAKKLERFNRAKELFENDANYRALHLTIARLFAIQLKTDIEILRSGKNLTKISLAAKWTPSPDEFHDKHTKISGTIAEILHAHDALCPAVDKADRAQYLILAKMALRKSELSPLRKQLEVVERDISGNTFANIKYDHVPSLAMERYQKTFIKKDEAHFNEYLDEVMSGSAKISGAILLPSQMVQKVKNGFRGTKALSTVQQAAEQRVSEGQWQSIVKRVKDSGSLSGCIAVCDVSGSMSSPTFSDGTTPMDAAVGLSLLLAEVVDGPFGGHIITFHEQPSILEVGGPNDKRSFLDKIVFMANAPWGGSTDLVAVFEKLILPTAKMHKIKPEDMIKQVIVFTDMQFNAAVGRYGYDLEADSDSTEWSSSFERIKQSYAEAGYEMPTLVFWDLAGGREFASKPVGAEEPGTALVSGYSQGQLKMFLDGGEFEELEVEETVEDAEGDEGEDLIDVRVSKKQKVDPFAIVMRAISHPAYAMLKVID